MLRRLSRLSMPVLLLLLAAFTAAGQTTGTIEGTVTDPTGAPVPNAAVVIRNEATGVETRLSTNDSGYFRSADRPGGTYSIRVDQPGFKQAKVSGIKLDINAQVRRDITLTVGELTESVQVEASAVQVNTSTG